MEARSDHAYALGMATPEAVARIVGELPEVVGGEHQGHGT
jgi:hypothetical protein